MKEFYNEFWRDTHLTHRDSRSLQRAKSAWKLLKNRSPCSLLDIGCGRGIVGEFFLKRGFEVFGVDFSEVALKSAKKKGIQTFLGDIHVFQRDQKFPVILCLEVFEHLLEPMVTLKKNLSHLEDSGVLVISLPNEFHILRRIGMFFGHFPFSGHKYHHLHLFSPKTARQFLKEGDLKILEEESISLVPPRYPIFFQKLGKLLAFFSPNLFAISLVFKVQKEFLRFPSGQKKGNGIKSF